MNINHPAPAVIAINHPGWTNVAGLAALTALAAKSAATLQPQPPRQIEGKPQK